jgi:antitoxin (DNA-binding transcriptional repressor) of toxin-antitoxin stability system
MKRTTVRELHLQTSAIVKAVLDGESYIIEKSGVPIAELRPFEQRPASRPAPRSAPRMPNREAIISKMKRVGDSGRILEEDRS